MTLFSAEPPYRGSDNSLPTCTVPVTMDDGRFIEGRHLQTDQWVRLMSVLPPQLVTNFA